MSSQSDEIVRRAVEKYAKTVERDAEGKKLNGLAKKDKEQLRVGFLAAFAAKLYTVIEPALKRSEGQVNGLSHRWSDNAEAARQSVDAEINKSSDEDRIVLSISREGKAETLTFYADPLKMKVEISSRDGFTNAQLNLDQIEDENIAPLVAGFVVRALDAFLRSTR